MAESDMSVDQSLAENELPHSYKLKGILMDQTLPSDPKHAPDLTNATFFPWHTQSLRTLWGGKRITTWPSGPAGPNQKPRPIEDGPMSAEEVWLKIVQRWMGCVAVCARNQLRLIQTRDNLLTSVRNVGVPENENIWTVTWALDFDTLHPLVVFAGKRAIIRIIDVETWERVGAITGHGAPITHLTTHPTQPNYILSTSRDWTARMWSLADPASTPAVPAYWPGQKKMAVRYVDDLSLSQLRLHASQTPVIPLDALVTRTGPAGSVPDINTGGIGKGACVAVFKGTGIGLGGHQSWILHADFHPTKPFVATSGADRAVKIWRVPDFPTPETRPMVGVHFSVVELPLFSSTHLHESAIDYVKWVTHDMLVTKSKHQPTVDVDFSATVALWRWLDVARFAPEGLEPKENEVKPSYIDYHESRAYRMVSDLKLPYESTDQWRLDVCSTWPDWVLTSKTDTVHIIDVHKHMSTPEILANRARPLESKAARKARKRTLWHPVDLDDVPHPMVRARGRDGLVSFQFLKALLNPLCPRALLGVGMDGVLALWYDDSPDE